MEQQRDDPSRHVERERRDLADLLTRLGPEQPTLCEGWSTRDLAAHLVVRERRVDSMPGVVLPPLAHWTERVRARQAARPYEETVEALRAGPPAWSPFALPGAWRANLTELFVHAEDVRRGSPGWSPRGRRRRPGRGRPGLPRHPPRGLISAPGGRLRPAPS